MEWLCVLVVLACVFAGAAALLDRSPGRCERCYGCGDEMPHGHYASNGVFSWCRDCAEEMGINPTYDHNRRQS